MDKQNKAIGNRPRQLEEGFDPGQELWERLVADIIERGGPCLDTVEELVGQACQLPANPEAPGGGGPGGRG